MYSVQCAAIAIQVRGALHPTVSKNRVISTVPLVRLSTSLRFFFFLRPYDVSVPSASTADFFGDPSG